MKKIIRYSTSVLLVLILISGLFTSVLFTTNAASIASGSCGTNAEFNLYNDNILVISGEGAMDDYESAAMNSTAPWNAFYDYTNYGFMQKIVMANGITSVGNYAFRMRSGNNYIVNLINLPDSLLTIGEHAFENETKIESITIPQKVTNIGSQAFNGCTSLKSVNCYAEPANLSWNIGDSGLSSDCKIHVMANKLSKFQTLFSSYSDKFIGDLVEPTNSVPADKNILVSYDDPSPSILAGALPYSVKAVNSKGTWPITYGARGFVTCIKDGDNYYALVNNNTGTLKKLEINSTSGKALHISEKDEDIYSDVTLKISHEYIGANSIKIFYTVTNNTASEKTFMLGSSGDIKIGQDDYAAIKPLVNGENEIGITMTSSINGDKINDKSPTLGFAAKGIGGSEDASYFYGAVNANKSSAATAVKSDIFIPERIFTKNSNSQETGDLTGVDSGLSFFWNVTLEANKEKQFAVIFTVPNTETNKENDTVIDEVKSNITTDTSGIYTTSDDKIIFFNNEVIPKSDDTLAAANSFSSLKNFLILGVQKKHEMAESKSMRFVSVVNTNILKDADEYGYILAKVNKETDDTYKNIRNKIDQITYDGDKNRILIESVKGTDNKISGDYGKYDTNTPYKYVTLGLNDVPESKVFIVRFFVKKGDTVQYADYYDSENNRYDGCSADWAAVTNVNHIGG